MGNASSWIDLVAGAHTASILAHFAFDIYWGNESEELKIKF